MSKQDRQAVRTPGDIETKYPLGQLKAAQDSSSSNIVLNQLVQTVNQYMVSTNAVIKEIRESINEVASEIESLKAIVEKLENGTASDTSAILDIGKLDSMILE